MAQAEWGQHGTVFQPMVWSQEGRCHPDVERIMDYVARAIARRQATTQAAIARRWKADIGVALAARRARMARKCLPIATGREVYVLTGDMDHEPGGREAALGALGDYLDGVDPGDPGRSEE